MDSVPRDQVLQAHPSLAAVVHAAGDVPVCLVGGAVRDLLLGRADGVDLDLVVEGDALALARRVGRELGLRVTVHERFGTAEMHLHDGGVMDFVGARSERYATPGALPEVTPGTLGEDLARRDFTVNAIALRLTGADAGAIVDPMRGRDDLAAGLVRILHAGSFHDDPSRVVRLARYAARLGFSIEPDTEQRARHAAPGLDLSHARVADELTRTVHEASAAAALELAAHLGVSWIRTDGDLGARFAALERATLLPGAPALPVWALRIGVALTPDALAGHIAVPGWAQAIARAVAGSEGLVARLAAVEHPSEVDRILRASAAPAQIGAQAAGADAVAAWWARALDHPVVIGGADLVALGVAPGPMIGRALDHVRAGVLDGEVGRTRDDQLSAALGYIRADERR